MTYLVSFKLFIEGLLFCCCFKPTFVHKAPFAFGICTKIPKHRCKYRICAYKICMSAKHRLRQEFVNYDTNYYAPVHTSQFFWLCLMKEDSSEIQFFVSF